MTSAIRGETLNEAASRVRASLELRLESTIIEHDEDIIIRKIMNFDAKTASGKTRTIGKMINDIIYPEDTSSFDQGADKETLDMYGILVLVDELHRHKSEVSIASFTIKERMFPRSGVDLHKILGRALDAKEHRPRMMDKTRPKAIKMPITSVVDIG